MAVTYLEIPQGAKLATTAQASRRLNITDSKVRELARSGQLERVQLGPRTYRIVVESIERYERTLIPSRPVPPGPPPLEPRRFRYRVGPIDKVKMQTLPDDMRAQANNLAKIAEILDLVRQAHDRDGNCSYMIDEITEIANQTYADAMAVESLIERWIAKEEAAERRAEKEAKLRQAFARNVVESVDSKGHFDPHGWFVYLLWGADTESPIYVGQSRNILSRLGSHLQDSAKRKMVKRVQLIRCKSAGDMDRLELQLIREYRPRLNVAMVPHA